MGGRAVQADDLVDRETGVVGHPCEIVAVVDDVDLDRLRREIVVRDRGDLVDPVGDRPQRGVVDASHQDRPGGRHDVDDARRRERTEPECPGRR